MAGRSQLRRNQEADLAPLAALPVEAVHRDHGLGSGQAREPGEDRGAERVVVHHVVAPEEALGGGEGAMGDGVEVLGVDAGKAADAHAAIHPPLVRVVHPAENIHLMAALDQAGGDLLHVAFDAAVGRRNALLSDHGDLHAATSR